MKVLFHTNTLNYRGTTVSLLDYAKYNQEILGNESIICYNNNFGKLENIDGANRPEVIENIKKHYQVETYDAPDELQLKIDILKPEVSYFIKAGNKDRDPIINTKYAVHNVFQFYEPHGDVYAYISKWLSDKMTKGVAPYVPHMVNLPEPTKNYREALNIRPDQTVIGRIGGYYTFDLPFVKKYISSLVEKTDQFVFLFANTEPFFNHPNIKHINEFQDVQKKTNFIDTCDAMLHARQRGESFGLSIAEFLYHNKPVISWNNGHDLNHLEMLAGCNTLYSNEAELDFILHNFKDIKYDWKERVSDFTPEKVMKKFKEVFLEL